MQVANFLELSNISKRFGGVQALTGVGLELASGEAHCLVGENGSGKSTLIKIISGVEAPEPGGRIVIDGHAFAHLTPAESTRRGIQVIYQDLSLFPNLTVAENITIGHHAGRPHRVDWPALRRHAEAAMARIGVTLDPDAEVADLPIAERQLVAICRAIGAEAKVIIMDEPTASLTRHEVAALLGLAEELKRRGIAIVFVSHRLDEVMEIAERVTVLRDGSKLGTFDAREMTDRRLAMLMTGKEFHYELKAAEHGDAATVLSVRGLARAGEFADIDLDVRRGEILGITGRLGSGRTELAMALFGMTKPDRGEIRLDGQTVAFASNHDAVRHGIAYVPEDRLSLGLVLDQPIGDNIILPVLDRLAGPLGLLRSGRVAETVRRWIGDLGIKAPDARNAVKTLSGGNQQRVVLAKWLATGPRLLILDSPTVGVDVSAKDGIYEIVRRLAADGMAVIMISDEVPEVLYHSHRILVMRGGRIAGEFTAHRSSEAELQQAVDA